MALRKVSPLYVKRSRTDQPSRARQLPDSRIHCSDPANPSPPPSRNSIQTKSRSRSGRVKSSIDLAVDDASIVRADRGLEPLISQKEKQLLRCYTAIVIAADHPKKFLEYESPGHRPSQRPISDDFFTESSAQAFLRRTGSGVHFPLHPLAENPPGPADSTPHPEVPGPRRVAKPLFAKCPRV